MGARLFEGVQFLITTCAFAMIYGEKWVFEWSTERVKIFKIKGCGAAFTLLQWFRCDCVGRGGSTLKNRKLKSGIFRLCCHGILV